MTQTVACTPGLVSILQAKPVILIPALVAAVACGSAWLAKPDTKDCEGMRAAVAADTSVAFETDEGSVAFFVANTPTPRTVCMVKVDQEQAMAYQQELQFTQELWEAEKGS